MRYQLYFLLPFLLFSFVDRVDGQLPLDILPIRSTCADVAKVLKVETCKSGEEVYDLKDEKIMVSYSTMVCQKAFLKRWQVPVGTVLAVTRIQKKELPVSVLAGVLNKCERSADPTSVLDSSRLSCESLGMSVYIYDGSIASIMLTPNPEDVKSFADGACGSEKPNK